MAVFDASSIIFAWDNYPPYQFPGLWDWLGKQVSSGNLVISKIAYEEVMKNESDCGAWLRSNNVLIDHITQNTLEIALSIRNYLGIKTMYGEGVNENDILIIASAKEHGHKLITNEKRQFSLPKNKKKYKIPAVCAIPSVQVPCSDFLSFIKESKQVFR